MTRSLTSSLYRFALGAALFATLGLSASASLAGDDEQADAGAMPPMGRPAQMDKIAFMQGSWNVEMKWRMGPGTEWQTEEAKAETKLVLDGCAQRMDFTGMIMGMPFHGFDHSTYNRETKRFESVWLDNMGARMGIMYGDFNDDGQLVMEGESMENGVTYQSRATSTVVDDDTVMWTMEMSPDGESWFENMQMTYSRAK